MIAEYDGLIWEISDIPVGSSTPDDLYELSYHATTTCDCGEEIEGIAQYWSRFPDSLMSWLERVEYEHECEQEEEDDEDF